MTNLKIPQPCSVPQCSNNRRYKELCQTHYHKLWKGGIRLKTTIEEKFWRNVDKDGPIHPRLGTRCWLWIGSKMSRGYGQICVEGKYVGAHRYSYFLKHGKMPNDHALHRCDNPPCVNPDHIRDGTPADNMQDKSNRGRWKGRYARIGVLTKENV